METLPKEIRFESGKRAEETASGLLVAVAMKAKEIRFFETLTEGLELKMKKYTYSHCNKIETIVAGLAVGCRHVAEMQSKLVPDTVAANLFGMARFPDQSQINDFLRRFGQEQVDHLERAHQQLLESNSNAKDQARWLLLADGERVLPIDLDQTYLVTRSKRATGTAAGYFGRKRGNVGYKKSVAFLGQEVKEVLWLRLEAGNVHAQDAVPTVLQKIAALGKAQGISLSQVVSRGDSQYGNVGVVLQCQRAGVHYLFKGANPRTSKYLAENLDKEAVWVYRGVDSNGSRLWMAEAGEHEFEARNHPSKAVKAKSRAVLLVRIAFRERKKHGRGAPERIMGKVVQYEHYVTDLDAQKLPLGSVLDVYNDRETEESFFRAEQDGFGAQYLRTHKGEGEAAFLWLLASTANLLRWVQRSTFAGTPLETVGLAKLVTQIMRIPATIIKEAKKWTIVLPETVRWVHELARAWVQRVYQLPLSPALFGDLS